MKKNVTIFSNKFASLDFESLSSKEGSNDLAVQVGVAIMDDWQLGIKKTFSSYIKPSQDIYWSGSQHSLLNLKNPNQKTALKKNINNAPSFFELWMNLKEMLQNRIIISHSNGTEKKFLKKFPIHGFDNWLDTLKISRFFYPNLKNHKLGHLIETIFEQEDYDKLHTLCPGLEWHDALYDAVATMILFKKIIDTNNLTENSLKTLQSLKKK